MASASTNASTRVEERPRMSSPPTPRPICRRLQSSPRGSAGRAISGTVHVQPRGARADRFMRGLLRVGDTVDKHAIIGARRSTTTALVVSGVRCTITYVLIPILTPVVMLVDTFGPPISIALSSFAIVMGIRGVRRFWIADHRARWSYTTFIVAILVMLCVAIFIDVRTILGV